MKWLIDALQDIYQKAVDTVYGWYESFRDWVIWIVDSIIDWFWDIVSYLIGMVWDFCVYLYDLFLGENGFVWYIFDWAIMMGNWFISMFPNIGAFLQSYSGAFNTTMILVGKLNQFFPLTELVTLLGFYVTFMLLFLVVKFIMKLIPTIG